MKQNLNSGFEMLSALSEKQRVWIILGLYYGLSVTWALVSPATWDDDCVGRYFNTLNALSDPKQFVSLWNRPLWVLLFVLPVQLGKFTIPVLMSAINVLTASNLFAFAKRKGWESAWLIVPLLLFQPFFFGVGRDAMTEPLAACLIAIGLNYYAKEQWSKMAIAIALLPLARMELILLFPFWIYALPRQKRMSWSLFLFSGIALLALLGMILHPEYGINWLWDYMTQGQATENRYGHKPIYTYVTRYYYVLGPVVFTLFLVGLFSYIKKTKTAFREHFVVLQFCFGFVVYSLFASYFNIGNSAGFLRNLVSLSPLAALIALEGYRHWSSLLAKSDKAITGYLLVFGLCIAILFSDKLHGHHERTDVLDYFGLLMLFLFIAVSIWYHRVVTTAPSLELKTPRIASLSVLIAALIMAHTLISEPPQASDNPERKALSEIAHVYKDCLSSYPLFCNNSWFYWTSGINMNTAEYGRFEKATEVQSAPDSSIFIWDTHRSKHISQSVFMSDDADFQELFRFSSSDHLFTTVVYQRLKKSVIEPPAALACLTTHESVETQSLTGLANFYWKKGDMKLADQYFVQAVTSDNAQPYDFIAYANFLIFHENFELAHSYYSKAIEKNKFMISAYVGRAQAASLMGNNLLALYDYSKMITLNPEDPFPYYERGTCYILLQDLDRGCADFRQAAMLGHPDAAEKLASFCGR